MEKIKKLVADDVRRIELHDRIGENLDSLLDAFEGEQFSRKKDYSPEEFRTRIERCEELTNELCAIQALLGYWGTRKQSPLFTFPIQNIATALKDNNDNKILRAAKWHAVRMLYYYGGVSTIAANDYQKLFQLFDLRIPAPDHKDQMVSVGDAIHFAFRDVDEIHNKLIANDNHSAPSSEYLFNRIREEFDDVVYLGSLFEPFFDRLELIHALSFIDRKYEEIPEEAWAPIGRFGYKVYGYNPYQELVEEAERHQEDWQVLKAGFFQFDYNRFLKICESIQDSLKRFRFP